MRCRDGVEREASYAPHELALMRGLRSQLDGDEASWASDSMMVIHELKSLLPGSEILDEPRDPLEERVGRYHANGADTELAAAVAAAPRAGTARARVLEELRRLGAEGATDFELNEMLLPGRRSVSAGTRRAELIRDGWPIVDSGRRRQTDTSTPAIVWMLDPVT
jgi:hypothetical protein